MPFVHSAAYGNAFYPSRVAKINTINKYNKSVGESVTKLARNQLKNLPGVRQIAPPGVKVSCDHRADLQTSPPHDDWPAGWGGNKNPVKGEFNVANKLESNQQKHK